MKFGKALKLLKAGERVGREAWVQNTGFIYLNPGSAEDIEEAAEESAISPHLFEQGAQDTMTRLPSINYATADGIIVPGWTPNVVDLLADDWSLVELIED